VTRPPRARSPRPPPLGLLGTGALAALAALALGGCATLGYYAQSVDGHLRLLAARRSLDALLGAEDTPPDLRGRLEHAAAVREFAVRDLGLPDNGSYRSYAEVDGRYVAWTVVATPELSLQPRTWCFPVAGCVAYRGYFSEAAAEGFADGLRREGLDVHVAGVAAYSTLGWFDDPLPSNVLQWPEADLAALVFHELAHQQVYVRDDTAFNEAFAVTVEEEGVRRWLAERATPEERAAWDRAGGRREAFLASVLAARRRLEELYRSDLPPQEMRARKSEILADLDRACHPPEGAATAADGRPRSWCDRPSNNARIAAVATYHELVPGFRALLRCSAGDLPAFYRAVAELGRQSPEQRRERLARAAESAAAGTVCEAPSPGETGGDDRSEPVAGRVRVVAGRRGAG
jgi:predicted aminopeptidase